MTTAKNIEQEVEATAELLCGQAGLIYDKLLATVNNIDSKDGHPMQADAILLAASMLAGSALKILHDQGMPINVGIEQITTIVLECLDQNTAKLDS